MSRLLMNFFDEEFLPVQDLKPIDVKRYRNAIGRASQLLEHPADYVDAIEPGFRKWYVGELLKLGFSIARAESFAACIRKLKDAMREGKRVTPSEPDYVKRTIEFLADRPLSIAAATRDILSQDDDMCAHAISALEEIQAFNRASDEESEVQHG